jgi:hypothetical protein
MIINSETIQIKTDFYYYYNSQEYIIPCNQDLNRLLKCIHISLHHDDLLKQLRKETIKSVTFQKIKYSKVNELLEIKDIKWPTLSSDYSPSCKCCKFCLNTISHEIKTHINKIFHNVKFKKLTKDWDIPVQFPLYTKRYPERYFEVYAYLSYNVIPYYCRTKTQRDNFKRFMRKFKLLKESMDTIISSMSYSTLQGTFKTNKETFNIIIPLQCEIDKKICQNAHQCSSCGGENAMRNIIIINNKLYCKNMLSDIKKTICS